MQDTNVLRVGIVGCGRQGSALATAVTRIPSLRLVAGGDPIAEAAANVARLAPDVRTFSSVEGMLSAGNVDAILVATPHHMLQPVALAAVRASKHVMAEKPVALNEQQLMALEDAVDQKGVCFLSGYSFRFSVAKYVRELLDTGVVGEIHALLGSICLPPMNEDWSSTPETGGGPLLYVGSHLVDMALWYADDTPAEVRATMRRRADTGADETTALEIRFSRGATAQLFVSQGAPTFFFTLDVIGRLGRITLRGWSYLHYEIELFSNASDVYAQPTVIHPRSFQDDIGAVLVPELTEFANAVREQRQPAITVHDGRKVLRVLDATIASAEAGKSVVL